MNNWRAVGYFFLGCGSIFLIYALIVFLSLTSMFSAIPSLAQATIALAVNAPWLIISYLAYVAGFICYYARRENLATSIEAKLVDTQEYTNQPASSKIDSLCSFPVSVSVDESYFKLKPKPESLNVSLEPKILQQIKEKLEHN